MDFDICNFVNSISTNCTKIAKKTFKKGETVTTYTEKRNQLCILTTGEAELIRYDYNGNKTIISQFSNNSIFGEAFYPTNTENELFVLAKTNCTVLFFSYNIIFQKCKNNCGFHKELSQNIQKLIMKQLINLNLRIELLTKKNTRDKLLSYFNILSERNSSKNFMLPFSLTDLADYLSVDRSAMMRELASLKDNGFIKKEGRKITLLKL